MPELREFYFVGTEIIEGDLTPLLGLRHTGFFRKRHYSHTPGWRIHALKPARGFDFVHRHRDVEVDANQLKFEPTHCEAHPGELGIQIVVPERMDLDEDAAWRIVEHGIGEEQAALLNHFEVVPAGSDQNELLPIEQLSEYLRWHVARRARAQS
jgi:hypothetical protein